VEQGRIDRQQATEVRGEGTPLPVLVAICLLLAIIVGASTDLFNDGDTSWHLAAGDLILRQGAVPATDPFSFTFAGKPWVAHEWLAEVAMAGFFAMDGWAGLATLTAAAMGALFLIIGLEARRWMRPLPLAATFVGIFLALAPFTLARPHVTAWPLLAGWALLLVRAREARRGPPLAGALIMLLWANLHASYFFGLLLIGPFALEALIEEADKKGVVVHWGGFGLLSLALSLLTPHGVHGLLYPFQVSSMKALPLIQEWGATVLAEMHNFEFALFAALFILLLKGVKVPLIRLLLLLGLLYLALEHVRHQAVFVILAALILPAIIARSSGRPPSAIAKSPGPVYAGLAAIAALAVAVRLFIPLDQPDSDSNPLTAISQVPQSLRSQPVFNTYGFGGPLIRAGIRPYVDGRGDMYGDDFLFEFEKIRTGDMGLFRGTAKKWNIGWTILDPSEPLAAKLDQEPGWRRLYADKWAVIHVRGTAPAPR
jgi:hypothetical protein